MIENIKELLQNVQLQQQIKATTDLNEVIKLITTAGVEKGYSFTQESVAKAIDELMLAEQELSEGELQAIAGGLRCEESGSSAPSCECGGGGNGTMYTGPSTTIFSCCNACDGL